VGTVPVAHRAASASAAIPPPVIEDLALVEQRLSAELVSREPRLTEIARHLVAAGGKRIRPMVVSLVFHATATAHGDRRQDAVEAAVALELIHTATLLHDDIIDGGEIRRGQPSALRRFGLADTLVAGDFLFCRAFALCARFEPEVVRWAAEACVSLTEGEMLQGRKRRDPAVTETDYLEIIRRKTASLFAVGARTAAHLAGASPAVVDALATIGEHVGLAFQMSDDLLDVAPTAVTGKPRGIDIRDGNPSLPIVLSLPKDPELARIFTQARPTRGDIETAIARIHAGGALAEVAARARQHLDLACQGLGRLPPSPFREALRQLVEGLADRLA